MGRKPACLLRSESVPCAYKEALLSFFVVNLLYAEQANSQQTAKWHKETHLIDR